MPRVLLYVNISLLDNPRSDGCEIFAKNLVKSILSKRSDFHFYVLTDSMCLPDFEDTGGHVTVIPIAFRNEEGGPGWARFQRFHTNMKELWDKLVKKPAQWGGYDYDICFNQQPEITPNISTLLNSYKGGYYQAALQGQGLKRSQKWKDVAFYSTKPKKLSKFKLVPFVNYFQVLAIPGDPRYDPVEFFKEVEGIFAADVTCLPSNWIRSQVLAVCRSMFTPSVVDTIKQKIKVLYFGIPFNEFEMHRNKDGEKYDKFTIGWNSRILSYTGYDMFVKYMKDLWKIRKDFQVMFFDPMGRTEFIRQQNPELPIIIRRLPREEYIREFSKCDVVAGTFRFQQFPQALTDAMICSIPVVSVDKFALPEIMGEKYPYLYDGDKDFLTKIQQVMDNESEAGKWGDYLRSRAKQLFDWNTQVQNYIKVLDEYAAIEPPAEVTEKMKQLLNWILDRGGAKKLEIYQDSGWGMTFSQIPFMRYRKYLLSTGLITEDYTSAISHFMPKGKGQTTLTMPEKEPDIIRWDEQPSALELEFGEDKSPIEELKLDFQ